MIKKYMNEENRIYVASCVDMICYIITYVKSYIYEEIIWLL